MKAYEAWDGILKSALLNYGFYFFSVSVVPLSESKENDERMRLQPANSSAEMKTRKKGQLNNNKMDDKWNMELSTAKTYLPSVLKAKKKKWLLLSLSHIGSNFMFRKPEETIKIERNKIEMLLRNNFCSLLIHSFRYWHQLVRCVYQPFHHFFRFNFLFFLNFYQFSIFIPILLFFAFFSCSLYDKFPPHIFNVAIVQL